jgi:GDP-4-dehydro-6-deoxy-D-mannose reductase
VISLVTGADGFVGGYLVRLLRAEGRPVLATYRTGAAVPTGFPTEESAGVTWIPLDLGDRDSVRQLAKHAVDAVYHLAAVASGQAAREDPGQAWAVNAGGTARLLEALASAPAGRQPRVLVVSSGEGCGRGAPPLRDTEPLVPRSPYAASKVGAEVAALEVMRRTGLPVIIARPFPHTGPGQTERYVVPAFAARLRAAAQSGASSVRTGNLSPVRDFLDVRDVVRAYTALIAAGQPGEVYNVASGSGISLEQLFQRLAAIIGVAAQPEPDPALQRPSDLPYLVGDASRLASATGWRATIPLTQTLQDLVDAQAD